jgi:hypothetical protein
MNQQDKIAVETTNLILKSLKESASPSKAPISIRKHWVIFFCNMGIATGGFAFFMAGDYFLEPLYILAYIPISNFVLFVYFTHSAGQYTIKQSILITIAHLAEPTPRKRTVANGFILSLKENNYV